MSRMVTRTGEAELWHDEGRSRLAGSINPGALTIAGQEMQHLVHRTRPVGPDWNEAMLTSLLFRGTSVSPRTELLALDGHPAAAGALALSSSSSNGSVFGDHLNGHHYRGGLPLFRYDREAHEAAWALQRVWHKRKLRRGEVNFYYYNIYTYNLLFLVFFY